MPTLFPEDYEKKNLPKKRKLIKQMKKDTEVTALSIALHAHEIYDYLKKQEVKNPNGLFVEAFQYASTALGVPYGLIDEAFLTRTPLTEEELFEFSKAFNPKAQLSEKSDLPEVVITIDFYSIVQSLFEELPEYFWKKYKKEETLLPDTEVDSYHLESLLQGFLQEVWHKTKEQLGKPSSQEIENAREMFLAYFYSNDQKHYRKETQEMLLECLRKMLQQQSKKSFKANEEIIGLLEKGQSSAVSSYVYDHLFDWTKKEFYQRFLRSVVKTKNLSVINRLLLLYQQAETSEIKEVHDWLKENRTIKNEAKPVLLLGESSPKVDRDTGEILEENGPSFHAQEHIPIVPYFEREETEGRLAVRKFETNPKQLFTVLEKMTEKEIVFEELEQSIVDDYRIHLKSGQTEKEVLIDLVKCIVRSEGNTFDSLTNFENDSVVFVIVMIFGLEPVSLDFDILEHLKSQQNGKMKFQQLLQNVIVKSERFLESFEQRFVEKEPVKIRESLEEEIRRAKELQALAVANIATEKENKKEQKAETPFSMDDYLQKVKETSEGKNDEDSD